MSITNAISAKQPRIQKNFSGNEKSLGGRRETEPLFAKAQQVISHYDEAMGCSTALLDGSGKIIKTPKFKKQMHICELCRKYLQNPIPGLLTTGLWEGSKLPCEKTHSDSVSESRRTDEPQIYACEAGFAFWTAPLYLNGRYAGSMTAGHVLFCGREEAMKKIQNACKDKIAAEKFNRLLEDVEEKNHGEIQSMARLLGVCAKEISKKAEENAKPVSMVSWHEEDLKEAKQLPKLKTTKTNLKHEETGAVNPLEKERLLLAAYQRGDSEKGNKILMELMKEAIGAYPDNFEAVRLRAIELLVLLSRAAVHQGPEPVIEANNLYLKRLQESETTEKLLDNLQFAAGRMAGNIFSFHGKRHASALRKAQRYIWENYTRKITLEEISIEAGLSAPYFSTIFNEEMGEKLSVYLNRLRVEKAAVMLKETGKSLNKIAEQCGFEDQSWFSKVFKNLTGISPGKYREKA